MRPRKSAIHGQPATKVEMLSCVPSAAHHRAPSVRAATGSMIHQPSGPRGGLATKRSPASVMSGLLLAPRRVALGTARAPLVDAARGVKDVGVVQAGIDATDHVG